MLRAHAIKSDFDENTDDFVKGWILTSENGTVLGLSSSLSERLAKKTAAQTAITWRCHVNDDWSYTGSNAHFAVRPMKALGIRRDSKNQGRATTLLCTIEDRRIGQTEPFDRRACAMATVKEKMIVVAMSGPLEDFSTASSASLGQDHDTAAVDGLATTDPSSQTGVVSNTDSRVEPGPDSLPEDLMVHLLAKAEGMAEHMRGELLHFKMPDTTA